MDTGIVIALILVATLYLGWLAKQKLSLRKNGGCSGSCGCKARKLVKIKS